MNPAYLGELRALDPRRARGFTGAGILDVLGIEVDGVDIAAGVGEARVLVAVEELLQALLRLGEGAPAAQATIGPGPTELVIEARGADALITLVSLAPPARVLAGGLLVDAQKLRAAALHAARGLLLDLLAISPALGDAPVSKRLGDWCAELARKPGKAQQRWPVKDAVAKAMVFVAPGARRRSESLQLQLPPETVARLREQPAVAFAPLAPHLGHGSIALTRRGAPGLACEGAVFLLVRNLLGEAERLVESWEAGARDFALQFGPHELQCDLTTDLVRAPGWRKPAALPALRIARLLSLLALGYAAEGHAGDELARDLRERALGLEQHCGDLESGDLRRAPATVASPVAPPPAQPRQGPLSQGRMRRLVYREAWRAPLSGALRALPFAGGPLVIELPDRLDARGAETGDALWKVPAAPGAVVRDADLFYAEPGDALVRLEVATGEVRWKRRLRGAAHPSRLWALPGGILRSLPGEGLALVGNAGTLSFRARLPGGAPLFVAAVEGVLVAALGSGSLAGLDPADGRILWKRRCDAKAIASCGSRALVLSGGALACIDPHRGEPVWERGVPDDSAAPVLFAAGVALLGGGELLSFSLADGAPRAAMALPWAKHLVATEEELFATGGQGEAARIVGLEAPGSRLQAWTLPPEGGSSSRPAQIHRGVLLLERAQPSLYEAAQGLPLAQLSPARSALLLSDLSVALLNDRDVAVHRLATHLSVL